MTKNSHNARKTRKIVRTPATKFAHLRKRMNLRTLQQTPRPRPKPFTKTP